MSGNLNITTTTFDAEIQSRLNAVDSNTPTQEMLKLYRASELFVGADYTVFSAELQSRLNAVTGSTESTELVKLAASFGKVSNDNEHGVPINGFMPLNVSDQAVYTAKSGSVWLRSGEELAYDPLIYPEAVPTVVEGYTGNSHSLAAQTTSSYDLTYDGSHFWVISSTGTVYKYDSSWVYTGTSFSVSTEATTIKGIESDGTNFYVLEDTGPNIADVHVYDSVGVYTGTTYKLTTPFGITTRSYFGIVWDGVYFWIIDGTTERAHRYNNIFQDTGFSFELITGGSFSFTAEGGTWAGGGGTWDGSYLWITNSEAGVRRAHQYTREGDYTGVSINFAPQSTDMVGAAWNGSIWMLSRRKDTTYEYNISPTKLGLAPSSDPITGLRHYLWIK